MAKTDGKDTNGNALILSQKSQESLITYAVSVLETKRRFTQFIDKLTAVDVAYACYKASTNRDRIPVDGIDLQKRLPTKDTTIPIIASQVDSVVAHLVDVFLTGSPLFPVVSTSKNKEIGEKFETIVDNHAVKGRYAREFQLLFRDAAKYNFCGIEGRWDSISEFSAALASSFGDSGIKSPLATRQKLTTTKRLDPYNAIWDYRVAPSEVADRGEYGGYVDLIGRVEMKRLLNRYSEEGININVSSALNSRAGVSGTDGAPITYRNKPQVSAYVNSEAYVNGGTWQDWLENVEGDKTIYPGYSNMYERAVIYARIIPSEHGIKAPKPNTPQIWRLELINEHTLIFAAPETSAYDRLPTMFGQAIEDGFNYQTRSIGEAQIPFQTAGSDLYNVRISGAKRAINDRGVYDPTLIDPADINSVVPAAKVPVKNLKMGKTLKDAYMPIPFQDGSTIGAMQDLQQTLQMSNMMFGINPFKQGQTVKGNRTLGEFQDISNNADGRSRLIALMMEVQIFMPLKDVIKLNILLQKDEITALNFNTGALSVIKPADFIDAVIEFKMADGFTPKSKLANTQQLQLAFQSLQQMPTLAAGYNMPDLFAHLMSLMGVNNLAQYKLDPGSKEAIMAAAMPYIGEMIQQMQAQQGQQAPTPGAPTG